MDIQYPMTLCRYLPLQFLCFSPRLCLDEEKEEEEEEVGDGDVMVMVMVMVMMVGVDGGVSNCGWRMCRYIAHISDDWGTQHTKL